MAEISNNKNSNKARILRTVGESYEISRADLSRATGLTRPTVSTLVAELESENLIKEIGKGKSKGGKRPILIKLREESVLTVGIDLADEFTIRGVVCDFHGRVLKSLQVPYENNFDSMLSQLFVLGDTLINSLDRTCIKGVGLSVSGIVDTNANEVIHSSNFDIVGKGLARKVSEHFNMPVFLENRPNAAALAESTIGAGSDYRNLIYLTTGRGVGAGVICDGKIFQGSYGGAGEIGKSIVFSRDDFMGRKLEVDLEHRMRASYLSEKASAVKGRRVSYSELLELYHEADPGIDRLICENAEYLACAASVICNFYNPEALILGGRKKELGARYLDYFKSVFDRHQANPVTGRTNVILSRFGRDGVAIGGAVIIIEKLLNLELN